MITLRRAPRSPRIDLHSHSTCSDGGLPPAELAALLAGAGLDLAALSDHDTLAGVAEFRREAAARGLRTVSGVEISCRCRRIEGAPEVHLLAYGLEPGDPRIEPFLAGIREGRADRLEEMRLRLGELGLPVPAEELAAEARGASPGRPHLARALLRLGHAGTIAEAFERWLGNGRPACVDKLLPGSEEAIAVVKAAGGWTVQAHPGKALPEDAALALVAEGVDGLEARHPSHRAAQVQRFAEIARRNRRAASGGSDWHGGPGAPRYRNPGWSLDQVGGAFGEWLRARQAERG